MRKNRSIRTRRDERGVALVMTLLVMMLMAALLVGFTTIISSDQRYRFIDHDRSQAFYAATGGMEKLTADLGNVFLRNVSPTKAQLDAIVTTGSLPTINNVTFTATAQPLPLWSSEVSPYHCFTKNGVNRLPQSTGGNGYSILFCQDTTTLNPTTTPDPLNIKSGPYKGLYGLKTPYQLDVTAKTSTGGEVHLIREIEAVAIPVFQFGIFSDVDLAFNAAADFSFGGRVHTNGNLFLAEEQGSTLTLSDKVTALKEIVRQQLSNGNTIDSNNDTGTVNMTKGGGAFTALDRTQGSVVAGPTSAANASWTSISIGTYHSWLANWRTGVKVLNLPFIAVGGKNTDLVRRPLVGEDMTGIIYGERLYGKASIRVLLSDTPDDIMNLPGIDSTVQPKSLEAGNTYGGIPVASSPGPITWATTTNATTNANATTVNLTAAVPAIFSIPATTQFTYTFGGITWTVSGCSTKTPTTMTNCTVGTSSGSSSLPSGAVLTPTTAVGYGTPTMTTTSSTAKGSGKTVNVVTTMNLAQSTFWLGDNIVTCAGFTGATTLNGCTGITAAVSSSAPLTNYSLSTAGTGLLGGYIKVERQNASDGTWHDITAELLGYGIGAPSQIGSCSATDPSPNAILRLQRLPDDGLPTPGNCLPQIHQGGNAAATDYWPNSLYDTRESWQRDTAPSGSNIKVGGVMYYIQVDATNLAKWFAHVAPYNNAGDTGNLSKPDNGGYSLYISDRRNNRDTNSLETGEYGWEDFVNQNSGSATATPNGTLDPGEDLNQNGVLDVYGGVPNCNGKYNALSNTIVVSGTPVTVTCAATFYATTMNPLSDMVTAAESTHDANFGGVGRAMVNRPVFFRRALKLVNGTSPSTYVTGLTVVTENPVYVEGDWNIPTGTCTGALNPAAAHAATAIIADAVTVMSSNWVDDGSFRSPYVSNNGVRSQRPTNSCYRMAILSGKSMIFPWISGTGATFGTDGGAHNFIRFLEGNGTNADAIRYRGSMATFYYSRQASGVFKGNGGFVYDIPPLRDYAFDTDFLTPSLLPPLTPMFRDVNTVGFSQELRPNK